MIASRQNKTLKDIRRLRRSKGDPGGSAEPEQRGLALLEGPHLVVEALACGLTLDTVLAVPGFLAAPANAGLARALARQPAAPIEVAPDLLDGLADADSPRGILAVARLPRPGVEGLPRVSQGTYLYIDGLQDPGNLGALARVAEAAGAAGLALSPGCVHPNHPRALRASAGSLLRLPVAVGVEAAALAKHLAPRGAAKRLVPREPQETVRWAALVPRGGVDLYGSAFEPPEGALVLAVGAEGPGLSGALRERADLLLTIPLQPPVESLNAVVAAALVLFELRRRRQAPFVV
ncbi:MAG TPA: RNA methyltransferase [Thermoanaerobaculia bacterium]|nr:RNA methyltransferase [Thermoanaerobaculia bacterium]